MKLFLFLMVFLSLFIRNQVQAQVGNPTKPDPIAEDLASDEILDYRLNKNRFLSYYESDDTSRAWISMFFRKRTN